MKNLIKGVVVLVIGGVAYTVSQEDVIKNLSNDTGMSEQQAEQYVESIPEEDIVSLEKAGNELIDFGQYVVDLGLELDCDTYEYDWQTPTLSCETGLKQITEFGNSAVDTGKSYIQLTKDSATEDDINTTINLITKYNANHSFEIIKLLIGDELITESKNTNSYNKSILQSLKN